MSLKKNAMDMAFPEIMADLSTTRGVTQTCFSKMFQYCLKEFWINLLYVLFYEIVFHAGLFCMEVQIPEQKEFLLKCLFLCFIVLLTLISINITRKIHFCLLCTIDILLLVTNILSSINNILSLITKMISPITKILPLITEVLSLIPKIL